MRTRLTLVAIVVAGAAISLLRVPTSHLDTVWAEDGDVFLADALRESPWGPLFKGYAGYQHLIPRIVAAILVSLAPLEAYGIAVFVACALLTGAVAAAVYWLSRDLVPWQPARLTLAGITILLPLAGQEVLGNLADFHSYCLWLAPWILLYRPRTLGGGLWWGFVAFLCAATEIQTLLFLPLLLFMVPRRHRNSWPIGIGLAVGLALQVATTLLFPRPSTAGWQGLSSLLVGYLYNAVLPLANTDAGWQVAVILAGGPLLPALIAVPFAAATVVVVVWGNRMQRVLVITLVLASGATYAAAAINDGSYYFRYTHHLNADGFEGILTVRYGVAAGLLLAATVPLAAAVAYRLAQARGVEWPIVTSRAVLAALLTLMIFSGSQVDSSRDSGVAWSTNVDEAREECDEREPTEVGITIAPEREVVLACSLL
ncbi:hypothetical protein M2152_002729 [Microbacteriaceae bacterium SG_E_30_P1]|uniref:Uncharacterized protein n=1 Tax=Antiquaquibacter oligotrophicus TaxID=2880260 RepID=A0ABT6KTX3_9MICO|nr:hypothetical protein [Antiquaquibacter oligotrophicus]MDH6182547.1 hypothetical protein [Antiquaquibacter oligotrophicus]UDF14486.1 hypothetical protein LH407_06390 [Antiquaquibacter oligotrophicus]